MYGEVSFFASFFLSWLIGPDTGLVERPADHGKRQVAPALDVSLGEFTNLGIGVWGKGAPVGEFGG